MRHTSVVVVGGMLLCLASPARADAPAACGTVRLADIGWADVTATTAMAALLLRDLGYTPKITALSIAATYLGLRAKEIDAFLGNWMPGMAAERKPYTDDHSIDVLGPNLQGAKYTLAVPQYTYDKGLRDFADIQIFGKDLDYKIYGIEPGNDGNAHVKDLLNDANFGLARFQLVEGSEQSMLARVRKAFDARKPIVFLGWQPHPMNREFKLAYLAGGDEIFGPNFGAADVYTNVRAGYAVECPNVGRLLGNLTFDLAAEDSIMDAILNRTIDPAAAALSWLRGHKAALRAWLDGVTTLDGKPGEAAVAGKL